MHRPVIVALLSACAVVASAVLPAAAEEGVTADTILFGQSAPLEGPASALGRGMRLGILAAFDSANRAGGIHARMLKLISRDDAYEPDRSILQTRKLIDEDKVFALIGAVGTPTSKAAQPIAAAANVPFIGPFTGAAFLRDPKLTNVINVRASYDAETEAWIKHLTEDLKIKKIAIFYQDDAFGRSGLDGVKAAMAKRGIELAGEATYERNTVAVKTALLTLKRDEPEAVVMVGAYTPCAEFIKLARKIGFNPVFVNISFVGASALAKELGTDGQGVIVSQVVPFPWDVSLPVVADYQAALKAEDPQAQVDFVSLEGYLVGRLAMVALEKTGADLSREGLLATIRSSGRFSIGGLVMNFGPDKNDGLDEVFMTVIQADGSFKPVQKLTM
jgi:branched-chain amino acid transport system substrate-binding protein